MFQLYIKLHYTRLYAYISNIFNNALQSHSTTPCSTHCSTHCNSIQRTHVHTRCAATQQHITSVLPTVSAIRTAPHHCNTRCNHTLQPHAATTRCNHTLQHILKPHLRVACAALQHSNTPCNAHCNTECNHTLQHAVQHTLQHTSMFPEVSTIRAALTVASSKSAHVTITLKT